MEASFVLSIPLPSSQLQPYLDQITPTINFSTSPLKLHPSLGFTFSNYPRFFSSLTPKLSSSLLLRPSALAIDDETVERSLSVEDKSLLPSSSASSSSKGRDMLPKVDKSGRFCSPRAARELALSILYASCIEGSDPVRLFEKRMNARREPGFEFDKAYLIEYNPMNFGGPPVTVDTIEEADGLQQKDDKESLIEAEVLAAPPKLVYSKLILRFTRKLLVAVADKWDNHVLVIHKISPDNYKRLLTIVPARGSRQDKLCILHLAMSEIAVLGKLHQIVINEAVDLAKRFCDGAAPRVINGCLRTFMKDIK